MFEVNYRPNYKTWEQMSLLWYWIRHRVMVDCVKSSKKHLTKLAQQSCGMEDPLQRGLSPAWYNRDMKKEGLFLPAHTSSSLRLHLGGHLLASISPFSFPVCTCMDAALSSRPSTGSFWVQHTGSPSAGSRSCLCGRPCGANLVTSYIFAYLVINLFF